MSQWSMDGVHIIHQSSRAHSWTQPKRRTVSSTYNFCISTPIPKTQNDNIHDSQLLTRWDVALFDPTVNIDAGLGVPIEGRIHHISEPYIGCPYPCPCPCPPMPMGFGWAWAMLLFMGGHGWASVGIGFVHPCIQLQIGVKLLECRECANQEALRAEASDSEWPFICPIQPRLGVAR
jgi:hypothetical protein